MCSNDNTYMIVVFFYFLVFTGCETQNKYHVYNTLGQQIFYVQEGKYFYLGIFLKRDITKVGYSGINAVSNLHLANF